MTSHPRHSRPGDYLALDKMPRGPEGRRLCRQCGSEVPKSRLTFCGDDCVEAWTIRSSSATARRLVFKRDKGICAICGLDAERLRALLLELWRLRRDHWQCAWAILFGFSPKSYRRQHLWEADHILPVSEGGGACGLDNYRTLCIWCHRTVTLRMQRRQTLERRARNSRIREQV